MTTKLLKINNCLQCPNHMVIRDPDPHDSFNFDDQAVVCKLMSDKKVDIKSPYASDRQHFRCVTSSCRPHHLEKECDIPKWCPLENAT